MKVTGFYLAILLSGSFISAKAQSIRLNDAAVEVGSQAYMVTAGNVIIDNNSQILNAGNIRLGGDWINNALGLNAPLPGTVEFNGTIPQAIGGANPTTFAFLEINNPSDVNLNRNIQVGNRLNFSAGKVNTGVYILNMITPPQIAITGADQDSYVNGNLAMSFPAGSYTYKYEIGNTVYAPAVFRVNGFTSPASVLGYTIAGDGPNENNPVPNASLIDPFAKVNQYWAFESTPSSFTDFEIEFDFTYTLNTGDPMQYTARRYVSSSLWNNTTGTLSAPLKYQVTSLTDLGEFVIGETSSTGIAEQQTAGFSFNNPVMDILIINLTGKNKMQNLILTDLHGRKIKAFDLNSNHEKSFMIDIKDFATGLYFLNVNFSDGSKISQKLIKQ